MSLFVYWEFCILKKEKKKVPEALFPSRTLPCSVNDSERLSWSPTWLTPRYHILPIPWWREQRFPLKRQNHHPRPQSPSEGVQVLLVSEKRFWKSRPGPCYGNPFTRGGWDREIRGRTTQRDPFEITFTCCCATWEESRTRFCKQLTAVSTDGKNVCLNLRFIHFNCNFHILSNIDLRCWHYWRWKFQM